MKMLGQGIDILYISGREVKAGMVKAVALKWHSCAPVAVPY